MITIYRNNGSEVLQLDNIMSGSTLSCQLQDHDYITLFFNLTEPVFFKLGDYVDTSFGRYVLTDLYLPKININNFGYEYQLRLDKYYYEWKNKILKYRPSLSANETSFNLTATIDIHSQIILDNLSSLGFTYYENGEDYIVDFSQVGTAKAKLVTYDSISIIDALNAIATAFNCEWWVIGKTIYFGKCESNNAQITLSIGNELVDMSENSSGEKYATRVFAYGSSRNIPNGYYSQASSDTTKAAVVQERLMLPTNAILQTYGTAEDRALLANNGLTLSDKGYVQVIGIPEAEIVEEVETYDEVYPKTDCIVGAVYHYDSTVTNDDGTTTTQRFYQVTDSNGLNITDDMIIEGKSLQIKFTSGPLNGMTFDCEQKYKNVNGTNVKVYEVVVNEDYGRPLPDSYLNPVVGNKYILLNWDSTKIANTHLIEKASIELLKEVVEHINQSKIDSRNYTSTISSEYAYNNGSQRLLSLGDKVKLINSAYFENGRDSRVIGYEIKLDIPYDSPKYTFGNKISVSPKEQLKNNIEKITFDGYSYFGAGLGLDFPVIRTYDGTKPTDKNVFSALKVSNDYISKNWFDNFFVLHGKNQQGNDVIIPKDADLTNYTDISIEFLHGAWTRSYLSALGQNPNSGGGGTSYNRLDSWASYDSSKAGWVLSALLGNDLNSRVTSLENGQIEGVATQEWVQNQGYLTELSAATINALGAIKIGYSANGKNYPVLLDNNNRAYVSVPWSDTWRPLGTGATDACAGNDARLSDARPASDVYAWAKASTKPTYTLDEVADGSSRKLSDYLPLTGGTISRRGTSYPLRINNPTGQNVRLVLELAEVIKGSIAYNDSRGTYIAVGDTSPSIYMGIKTDGTPYVVNDSVTENVIWHAGNDGANSGLDADLLDGQHGSYYAKATDVATLQGYFTNGVANNADKLDGYHASNFARLYIHNSEWSDIADIPSNLDIGFHSVHVSTKEYSALLVGKDYAGSEWQIYFHPDKNYTDEVYYRKPSKNLVRTFAFTNSNVASATKLATPRTIWGQSFDGSANVSGAMTGVTSVDGLLYFDTTTGFVKISGSSPSPLVLNSTSTYNYLYFRVNDSNKANIGWYNDNLGLIMQCGSNFVSLASTGDLKKNGSYKFWHEGNDGSGSGLDADMVDGLHVQDAGWLNGIVARRGMGITLDNLRYVKIGTLPIPSVTAGGESKFIAKIYGTINIGEQKEAEYTLIGSTRGSIYCRLYHLLGKKELEAYTRINGNKVEFYIQSNATYQGTTSIYIATCSDTFAYDGTSTNGNLANMSGYTKAAEFTYALEGINPDDCWSDGTHARPWYGYDRKYTGGIYSTTLSDYYGITLKTSLGLLCMDVVGNVGIGTTSPNYKLDVAGVIHSSVGMFSDGYMSALGQNTSSDERLKDIKGDINVSIDVLANAPSKLFEWKSNKALGAQVGTIAQYWQRALPQVVHDRGDGYLSMQYDVAALLGTITIAKRVQNHEERIKELERENEALREQLKEFKG